MRYPPYREIPLLKFLSRKNVDSLIKRRLRRIAARVGDTGLSHPNGRLPLWSGRKIYFNEAGHVFIAYGLCSLYFSGTTSEWFEVKKDRRKILRFLVFELIYLEELGLSSCR